MEEFHDSQALKFSGADVLFLIIIGGIRIHEAAHSGGKEIHDGVVSSHADGKVRLSEATEEVGRILLEVHVACLAGQELQMTINFVGNEGTCKNSEPMREPMEQTCGADDTF
jgi:hypothetical protein